MNINIRTAVVTATTLSVIYSLAKTNKQLRRKLRSARIEHDLLLKWGKALEKEMTTEERLAAVNKLVQDAKFDFIVHNY